MLMRGYIYVFFESFHTHTQAEFKTKIVVVRERMLAKEQEVNGKWMTEERLKGCELYST